MTEGRMIRDNIMKKTKTDSRASQAVIKSLLLFCPDDLALTL